jgi:hypothetical protein
MASESRITRLRLPLMVGTLEEAPFRGVALGSPGD